LATLPASTSACVAVYVAVQVSLSPGASDASAWSQVTADSPVSAVSVIPTLDRVWLPVLVTA